MSGNGTITTPFNLATALTVMRPRQTFTLRAGTYSGAKIVNRSGTANYPILFRAYPGERVIFDGAFTVNGEHTHWQNIEFADLNFTNRASDTGAEITISGNGTKFINCIVHDFAQGFSGGGSASEYEVYGCLVYFNGWDGQLGHNFYCQHDTGLSGKARFIRNLTWGSIDSGYNFNFYGSQLLDRFLIQENISFEAGTDVPARNMLMGGSGGLSNIECYDNLFYTGRSGVESARFGWGVQNTFSNVVATGNTFVGNGTALLLHDDTPGVTMTLTGNNLWGNLNEFVQGDYPANTYGTFANTPDAVYLFGNAYDGARAQLAIINKQALADTVAVDVSSLFANGDTITARNVQDYWNDTQSLTVSGGNITVNMQAVNRTVATPQGWTAPATTFPAFGAFVLERTQ